MGFRARLLLGLALAVILAAGIQAVIGYSLYKRWLDDSANSYVERYLSNLSNGVDMKGAQPVFDENQLSYAPSDWSWIRYRFLDEDKVYFEGPESEVFPANDRHWTRGVKAMDDGYTFEIALNLEEIRQSLEDYTRTTVLTLILTLGAALGLIALFFRFSMQPIRRLTVATQALTKERFPEPVLVPPGNDEVARLARSFNHMTKELKAFFERERSFTRYASHELRTPLSTTRAQIEALELDLLKADTVIPAVKDSLGRMDRILNGLLTLARAEAVKLEPIKLSPVIKDAITMLPDADQTRLIIKNNGQQATIMGQTNLLQQALFNLLDNALKYSEDEVVVKLDATENTVCIQIHDKGPGIPDAHLANVTKPFIQLEPQSNGAGLGLTLVNHIAEMLGGNLNLRNGSTGFQAELWFAKASVT